jgi:hypothetical protein
LHAGGVFVAANGRPTLRAKRAVLLPQLHFQDALTVSTRFDIVLLATSTSAEILVVDEVAGVMAVWRSDEEGHLFVS